MLPSSRRYSTGHAVAQHLMKARGCCRRATARRAAALCATLLRARRLESRDSVARSRRATGRQARHPRTSLAQPHSPQARDAAPVQLRIQALRTSLTRLLRQPIRSGENYAGRQDSQTGSPVSNSAHFSPLFNLFPENVYRFFYFASERPVAASLEMESCVQTKFRQDVTNFLKRCSTYGIGIRLLFEFINNLDQCGPFRAERFAPPSLEQKLRLLIGAQELRLQLRCRRSKRRIYLNGDAEP